MSNPYKIMVDISLTCRLHRDVDEKFEKFEIEIRTDDFVDSLKDKIYEKVNKINNKIFSDIKASQLELWKVHIHTDNEEKFSKLSLKNDDTEGIKELQRVISEYWEEQPPTKFIHVIIDSPYLSTLRKLKALTTRDSGENEENYDRDVDSIEDMAIFFTEFFSSKKVFGAFFIIRININRLLTDKDRSQNDDIKAEVVQSADNRDSSVFISDKRSGSHIHEMIDAGIIVLGDELRIDKKYRGIQVNLGCKIAKVTSSIRISTLSVVLTDDENEQAEISDWKGLEKWLLTKYKERANNSLNLGQIKFTHSTENIKLVRNGKTLGSIVH